MEDHEKSDNKGKRLQPEHAKIRDESSTVDTAALQYGVGGNPGEECLSATPSQQNVAAKRPLHENDPEHTHNEDRSFEKQESVRPAETIHSGEGNFNFPNKRLKSGNSPEEGFEILSTSQTPSTVQPSAKSDDSYSMENARNHANYSIATNYGTANQPPPTPPPSAASTATNSSSLAPSESATPGVDKRHEICESITKGDNFATSASPQKTPVSTFDNGNSWTDDDAYESMPKTPVAPPQPTYKRKNLRQNAMSPLPSSSGVFLPDVPPAPPTTPAAKTGVLPFSVDLGLATPLPYTAGFVQNANELEQQHRQIQKNLEQQQQQYHHGQEDLHEGAVTPAPPRPQRQQQSNTAKPPLARPTALSDDFSEWAVGDRYKLSRMLGRGSYGEVAQAIDLYQGRSDAYVAIKRIVGPFDQEVDAVRLFREIHILRRLRTLGKNDCIVPLLDVVQPPTDDLNDFHDLYLVFDYVDTDLYKLIMSPQYLTTEHIQTFLYQMLIGLKYIHSGNVIHRDLKPANILLNEDCSLKICDFGLARIVDETSVANRNSSSNRNAGSVNESSSQSIQSRGQRSPKKFLGRSCSISEQPLSKDDFEDIDTVAKLPLTRQLTKHVVTRWYRAPELILIQPYTTAVDVWSLGCIFAELLSMQEGSVPGYQDREPLFPGGACYPLSGDTDNAERLDQLNVIFNVIGTPSDEDIAYMGGANEYVKTMKPIKPKNLKDIYPAATSNALDLLQRMLKFNHTERCTAGEALSHKFFAGIRREEMETTVGTPMESPAFLNEQEIDIETLKQKAFNEVLWFRDNQSKPIETPISSSITQAE